MAPARWSICHRSETVCDSPRRAAQFLNLSKFFAELSETMVAPPQSPAEPTASDNIELPEELRAPPPREIPEAIKQGRLYLKNRAMSWTLAVLGMACVLGDGLPFIQTLALYFLPLEYLLWIGIGLCACAAYAYLGPRELRRAKQYIEQGEAAFGRVTSLVKTPTMVQHGRAVSFAIVANVRLRNPESGVDCLREMKSRSFVNKAKQVRFRVGDLVPVVWLPGKFERTAQIYDFLEVMPGHDLRDESTPKPLWMLIGIAVLLPLFFFVLAWNAYAMGRYEPIEFTVRQGILPFGVGASVAFAIMVWIGVVQLAKQREMKRRNAEAVATGGIVEVEAKRGVRTKAAQWVLLPIGAVLIGGVSSLSLCYSANALFDKSAARPVSIFVTEMIQETHEGIFREYKLKYRRAQDPEVHSLMTTPQHLSEFKVPFGVAQVRSGWLGWPWVETVDPVALAPPGPGQK
jgi:hypothetical protein